MFLCTKKLFSKLAKQKSILTGIFKDIDKNGDGSIDTKELESILELTGNKNTQLSKDIFKSLEKNNNKIDYESFIKLFDHVDLKEMEIKTLLNFWLETTKKQVPDSKLLFETAWSKLILKHPLDKLIFPREFIFLGGAPGSGKGTNTQYIMKLREMTSNPIVISSLLTSPSAKKIKDSGGLVGDAEVIELLLEEMLKPKYHSGACIDGFPRTVIQAECLKYLNEKLVELYRSDPHTYQRPIFRSVMLFVEEKESVERQLNRGKEIMEHNKEVKETGIGELLEIRATDVDINAARKRYKTFQDETYAALSKMKENFPFSFINAQGSVKETQKNIHQELAYQSSLELNAETHSLLNVLPTSKDIIQYSRQALVKRLEGYQQKEPELFKNIIQFISVDVIPIIKMHSLSGEAEVITKSILLNNLHSIQIFIDIMSDRGFNVISAKHSDQVKFKIRFPKPIASQ